MKPDFVAEFVALARDTAGIDARAAQQIEARLRSDYGGQTVRIAERPPVTPEFIDARLRERKSVREIAGEVGMSRATIYRMLNQPKSKACKSKAAPVSYKPVTRADVRNANREEVNAQKRERYWQNRDKILERQKGDPTKLARNAERRALRKNAVPKWFGELDELVLSEAANLAKHREKVTGIRWHIDHMIPLAGRAASGLHCAYNIQVIPAQLNTSKRNRMELTSPGEWLHAKSFKRCRA